MSTFTSLSSRLKPYFNVPIVIQVTYDVAKTYRLDPFDTFWEEDLGASLNATVIPMLKKSTTGTFSLLLFVTMLIVYSVL